MTTLVVVGGGITGLTAARELEVRSAADIVLLESSDRLGGVIGTVDIEGAVVETGPDWFVTRSPAALDLCHELGLADDLIVPAAMGALIHSRGVLRPLPQGFVRGFPSSPSAVLSCRHLGIRGRIRALAESLSRSPLTGPDLSVGGFTRARFGTELLERLVDPILAASRAGRADELSLAAAAPEIDAAARSGPSLTRALRRERGSGPEGPPFLGVRGGMSRLVDALAGSLRRTDIRTSTPARALRPAGPGYELVAGDAVIAADGLILAVPAGAASTLLRGIDARVADRVGRISYTDAIVLSLLYPPGAAEPPPGASGVLVAGAEGRILTAFAWYSAKWSQGRPPGGGMIIRGFIGRNHPAMLAADENLIRDVAGELGEIASVQGNPVAHSITRTDAALPIYKVGHLELVDEIDRSLPPRLAVAGAGYRGSGIPDCIDGGRAAAGQIMEATKEEAIR